jgi:hypothetical protein
MDEKVTFFDQMEENVDGVVIDIGKFNVNSEDVDQFVKTWASKAEIIKKSPRNSLGFYHCSFIVELLVAAYL